VSDGNVNPERLERRPEPAHIDLYDPPSLERLGDFAELTGGVGGELHADDGSNPSKYYD
jgi:hypothetical protein